MGIPRPKDSQALSSASGDALEIGRRANSVDDVARAYANLVDVLNNSARLADAGALAEEAFAYAQDHGMALTGSVSSIRGRRHR
jgi:hypothetical protein